MSKRLSEKGFQHLANKLAMMTLKVHRKYPYRETYGEEDISVNQYKALDETINLVIPQFIKENHRQLSNYAGILSPNLLLSLAGRAGVISSDQISEYYGHVNTTINAPAAEAKIKEICESNNSQYFNHSLFRTESISEMAR